MGTSREVVVVSGVRTAIGDYGDSLKDFPLVDLAASVVAKLSSKLMSKHLKLEK